MKNRRILERREELLERTENDHLFGEERRIREAEERRIQALPEDSTEAKIIKALEEKGYQFQLVLGEGNTGRTYRTLYRPQDGGETQLRVVKIPKDEIGSSVQTRINLARNDVDSNEAKWLTKLSHPGLVKVLETPIIHGRRTLIMHDELATDLETLVDSAGPLIHGTNQERFTQVFSQVLDVATYLSHEGVLHRDIKPSNILVDSNGNALLADLQNAKKRHDIEDKAEPTRGGAPYTHPKLLESLVGKGISSASDRTEVYSIVASMYYVLTGEQPFDYQVTYEGNLPVIRREEVKAAAKELDETKINFTFDPKQHERRVRAIAKKVPRNLRGIIYEGLSLTSNKQIRDVEELKRRFDKVKNNSLGRITEALINSIKPTLIATGTAAALGGMIYLAATHRDDPRPNVFDVLRQGDYSHFSYEDLQGVNRVAALEELRPTFEQLEGEIKSLEQKIAAKDETLEELNNVSRRSAVFRRMDPRTIMAWSTALYLADHEALNKSYEKGKRVKFAHFPRKFAMTSEFSAMRAQTDQLDRREELCFGMDYLKFGLNGKKFDDVMTTYFCDQEERTTAMARSGSITYFTTVEEKKEAEEREKVEQQGSLVTGRINPGYRIMLEPAHRAIIDKAVALYMIMNEEGIIQPQKYENLRRELDSIPYHEREMVQKFGRTPLLTPR